MREQRHAVAPHLELPGRERDAARDGRDGCRAEKGTRANRLRRGPRDHDEHADLRQVGEAIGHGLLAHLDEPDDGQERDEVPEPPHEQPGVPPALADGERRDDEEHDAGGRDLRDRQRPVRIEHREPRRPERLLQVDPVGDDRLGHSRRQRQGLERGHGARAALGHDRERARGRREQDERQLLPHERDAPRPAERPDVEEEQNHRQRHHHRLREEPQDEGGDDEDVVRRAVPSRVTRVRREREHPEQAGQHVLPLRDPRDGLDPERVQREYRGDERAPPRGPGHAGEHLEEERGARRVEQDAGRMMAGRRQPEELSVEHVREPGERVPVGRVGCGERPGDTGPRKARPDVHVLGHVFGVVVVDEAVPKDRDEDDGGQGNHARDGEMPPAADPHASESPARRPHDRRTLPRGRAGVQGRPDRGVALRAHGGSRRNVVFRIPVARGRPLPVLHAAGGAARPARGPTCHRQAGGTLLPVFRLPDTQSRMFTSPSPLPLIMFLSTRLRVAARS